VKFGCRSGVSLIGAREILSLNGSAALRQKWFDQLNYIYTFALGRFPRSFFLDWSAPRSLSVLDYLQLSWTRQTPTSLTTILVPNRPSWRSPTAWTTTCTANPILPYPLADHTLTAAPATMSPSTPSRMPCSRTPQTRTGTSSTRCQSTMSTSTTSSACGLPGTHTSATTSSPLVS
jgi:hypothetical protein